MATVVAVVPQMSDIRVQVKKTMACQGWACWGKRTVRSGFKAEQKKNIKS
ncbi:MAG: hypothetical protein KJ630_06450 [Proteobacteria bacterium]|nr:hypothetical protein [Pseudomonadota bacterium]